MFDDPESMRQIVRMRQANLRNEIASTRLSARSSDRQFNAMVRNTFAMVQRRLMNLIKPELVKVDGELASERD